PHARYLQRSWFHQISMATMRRSPRMQPLLSGARIDTYPLQPHIFYFNAFSPLESYEIGNGAYFEATAASSKFSRLHRRHTQRFTQWHSAHPHHPGDTICHCCGRASKQIRAGYAKTSIIPQLNAATHGGRILTRRHGCESDRVRDQHDSLPT